MLSKRLSARAKLVTGRGDEVVASGVMTEARVVAGTHLLVRQGG